MFFEQTFPRRTRGPQVHPEGQLYRELWSFDSSKQNRQFGPERSEENPVLGRRGRSFRQRRRGEEVKRFFLRFRFRRGYATARSAHRTKTENDERICVRCWCWPRGLFIVSNPAFFCNGNAGCRIILCRRVVRFRRVSERRASWRWRQPIPHQGPPHMRGDNLFRIRGRPTYVGLRRNASWRQSRGRT